MPKIQALSGLPPVDQAKFSDLELPDLSYGEFFTASTNVWDKPSEIFIGAVISTCAYEGVWCYVSVKEVLQLVAFTFEDIDIELIAKRVNRLVEMTSFLGFEVDDAVYLLIDPLEAGVYLSSKDKKIIKT